MAEREWPRHGLRLGVSGVRRWIRQLQRNRLRLRLLGFSALSGAIGFGGTGVFVALSLRVNDGPILIPGQLRLGVAGLWVFLVWFFAQRAITHWSHLSKRSFLLTTVSPRAVAVGMLLTEFMTAVFVLVLPVTLLVGIIGIAFLSLSTVFLTIVAVGLSIATTIVVGYALGFGSFFVNDTLGFPDQLKGDLGVHLVLLAVTGYVVAVVVFDAPAIWNAVSFEWIPMGWLVDFAVLGTPVVISVERAVAGFIGSIAVVIIGSLVVESLATTYWCMDTKTGRSASTVDYSRTQGESSLITALSPLSVPDVVSTPTRRVAAVVMLRIRREPRRMTIVGTVALSLALWIGVALTQLAQPMRLVPLACAVFIPWLAGALFSINPLGDEGVVLPATLTSPISGTQYVHGLMLPGALYGTPLACFLTLATGIAGPYTIFEVTGLVLLALLLTPIAVLVGITTGMYFPRFSSLTIGDDDIAQPSMIAIALYSACISGLGGTLIALFFAPQTAFSPFGLIGLSPSVSRVLIIGGLLGGSLLFAALCYHSAISRFEGWYVS